jgi:hypothetical protein
MGISDEPSPRCEACGKYFSTESDLKAHIEQLKKHDPNHKNIFNNQKNKSLKPKSDIKKEKLKIHYKPEFGKINLKKRKK